MAGVDKKPSDEVPGALLRAALITGLLIVVLQTQADPDLWGHVRFGLDILRDGIPTTDTYSFTTDRPWINHEWLAEIFMGGAYGLGGAVGVLLLKAGLVAGTCLLMVGFLRRQVAPVWPRTLLLAYLLLLGVAPLSGTMRPQVFSLVLFTGLMVVLATADDAPRRLRWLPPMFLVWVNVHGGWVAGLGILAVWIAATLLRPGHLTRRSLIVVGAVSAAATAVNPYGVEMWRFIYSTVGLDRHDITEWLPISQNRILLLPWSLTTLLAGWVVWRAPRTDLRRLAVCGLLAVMSFQVSRLVGFYGLAVGLLLAPTIWSTSPPRISETQHTGLTRRVSLATAVLVTLLWLAVQRPALACLPPAIELDPAASALLRAQPTGGRLVVYFNWGEYALWHLAPRFKVSLDGRRETIYSDETLTAHHELWNNGPEAQKILTRLDPDYIWIPSSLPFNDALREWGWQPLVETEISSLWLRPGAELSSSIPAQSLPFCFPGP